MLDKRGRNIDYLRISITDRCNLRCSYCMPEGIALLSHDDILSYEEILRVCKACISLGIVNFKVSGGEPLLRKGCPQFIAGLKSLPGVRQVTLTCNGLLLAPLISQLKEAGIDSITISLDTLDEEAYRALTGYRGEGSAIMEIMDTLETCLEQGLKMKINAVLLDETKESLLPLAALAREYPVDVRFIELMPIGYGANQKGISQSLALEVLQGVWQDLSPAYDKRGNGPAKYYASASLMGQIGFIDAVSHSFCQGCNRIRLTSTGELKACLSYEGQTDLRSLLRGTAKDEELRRAIAACIWDKPACHSFSDVSGISESKTMNKIGG